MHQPIALTFVHGVAVRRDDAYDRELTQRDQLFRDLVFKNVPLEIQNPYWGGHAAEPAWGWSCVPDFTKSVASFGSGGATAGPMTAALEESADTVLSQIAQTSFRDAVDTLFAGEFDACIHAGVAPSPQLLHFAEAAARYSELDPRPAWAQQILTNDEFVKELKNASRAFLPNDAPQTFGVVADLAEGIGTLVGAVRQAGSIVALAALRGSIHPLVARFIGDVFVYLKPGSRRDSIRAAVRSALRECAARAPVVAVGHSLGGVVLYDCLSDPDFLQDLQRDLERPFRVAALVTVGAQVGLFEELKLFRSSDPAVGKNAATPRMSKPGCVENWINVYDDVDPLSFMADPIFKDGDVTDFRFDGGTGLMSAHTTYFKRPSFYHRLRQRLLEKGVVS